MHDEPTALAGGAIDGGGPRSLSEEFKARFPIRARTPPRNSFDEPVLGFARTQQQPSAPGAGHASSASLPAATSGAEYSRAKRGASGSSLDYPAGTASYQVYAPHGTKPSASARYANMAINSPTRRRGAMKPPNPPNSGQRLQPLPPSPAMQRQRQATKDAVSRALASTSPGGHGLATTGGLGDALNMVDSRVVKRQQRRLQKQGRRGAKGLRSSKHGPATGPGSPVSIDLSDPSREYVARRLERRAAVQHAAKLGHKTRGRNSVSPLRLRKSEERVVVPASMGGLGHNRSLSHGQTAVMPLYEPVVLTPKGKSQRTKQRRASQDLYVKAGLRPPAKEPASNGSSDTAGDADAGAATPGRKQTEHVQKALALEVQGEDELQFDADRARSALLTEWLGSFHSEARHYDSVSIEAEVRLQKAALFAQKLGKPNQLGTAVAFQVIDDVFNIFGATCVGCRVTLSFT